MSTHTSKTYTRLQLPSDSDSVESVDDEDRDPDYMVDRTTPSEQRLNIIVRRNRLPVLSSSSESDTQSDANQAFIGPQNIVKTGKRLRKPESHKKNIAKKLRNSGERYVNVNGHVTKKKKHFQIYTVLVKWHVIRK